MSSRLAIVYMTALPAMVSAGAPPPPERYKLLRYEEDFSYLRDPAERRDQLDAAKYVPFGNSTADRYLSFGGDVRERYEYFRHWAWGAGVQDGNGYLLQRYMLHMDAHFSPTVRLFTQLKSNVVTDRRDGPRGVDEDRFDLHQAFIDIRWKSVGADVMLRVGRHEMNFGSSRLISVRNGPNVRQSFGGVRATLQTKNWKVDTFAVSPITTARGTFDDGSAIRRRFWGVYAVRPLSGVPSGTVDVYYFGRFREHAVFDQGDAYEHRHTIGTRMAGRTDEWDGDVELVYQFGSFGGAAIEAWLAASDIGYTVPDAPGRPRIGLRLDVASGDRDPRARRLQTFHALFPRGAFYTDSGLIGRGNIIDLHPNVTVQCTRTVTLVADWEFFWRFSVRDGVYGPSSDLLRSGKTSSARTVGHQPSLTIEWRPSPRWSLTSGCAYFIAGGFLRESGASENVTALSATVAFRF